MTAIVVAVARHTIIRYRPRPVDNTGPVVEVLRWRLFVDESHDAVEASIGSTPLHGPGTGARWDHDWSCEHLTERGRWDITGRQLWTTYEEALAATSGGTFATFEEALLAARLAAARRITRLERDLREAREHFTAVSSATAPTLPP